MSGKLAGEIRQRSFKCIEEEAALNVLRTAEVLHLLNVGFLKPYGLTPTQFNVLRILRGASPDGLACSEIGSRMIKHDPDITRLLERMEAARLIVRERSVSDRRVVIARITAEALALLQQTDQPQTDLLKGTLGRMKRPALERLINLLEQVREIVA